MTMDRIITIIGLLVAAVAAFVDLEWWPLILLLLGIINGFIAPLADMLTRTAYTVVAAALPTIANSLEAIPEAGTYLNAIFDNIALMIGGVVIANLLLVIVSVVMGSDSD